MLFGVGFELEPPTGKCFSCNKRKATRWYPVDGTAVIRKYSSTWCDVCVLEEQIKFARARAAALPELEKQLAALRAVEGES